jgi:hypothetical protein
MPVHHSIIRPIILICTIHIIRTIIIGRHNIRPLHIIRSIIGPLGRPNIAVHHIGSMGRRFDVLWEQPQLPFAGVCGELRYRS